MDKITRLEILARALLGGLVETYGREHAACVLARLAEGLRAGLPVDGESRCSHGGRTNPAFPSTPVAPPAGDLVLVVENDSLNEPNRTL